jgi:fatty acid desaturase
MAAAMIAAATRDPDQLRLERLARMAEADNWLHGLERPRRRRRLIVIVAISVVLAGCLAAAGFHVISASGFYSR